LNHPKDTAIEKLNKKEKENNQKPDSKKSKSETKKQQ